MPVIYQCDICKKNKKSNGWIWNKGWLKPDGWLMGNGGRGPEVVCGEKCAGIYDRKGHPEMMVPIPISRKKDNLKHFDCILGAVLEKTRGIESGWWETDESLKAFVASLTFDKYKRILELAIDLDVGIIDKLHAEMDRQGVEMRKNLSLI